MKRSERDEWCTALRSDKYKQGKAYLTTIDEETEEEYDCCMGVLCKIKNVERSPLLEKSLVAVANGRVAVNYVFRNDEGAPVMATGYPPASWNLPSERLAGFNDDSELSFAKIADWIEANIQVED